MGRRKPQKSVIAVERSDEFKKLVDQSIAEMDVMTKLVEKSGVDPQKAREKVASIYLKNLQQTDDLVTVAKKNIAELMTRIELERAIKPEEELISKRYIQLFKLQNETLKMLSNLEPKTVNHKIQVDDDKMIFDVKEGVYDEK